MHTSVTTTNIVALAVLTVATFGFAAPASAQSFPDQGGRVFGLVGGSFGDGGSSFLTSGGAGLRLTRNLGLDFEVLHVADLDLSDEDFVIGGRRPSIFPPPRIRNEGNVTAFLTKMTVDFPVAGDRLVPFVSGGGGVGRLSRQIGIDFPDRRLPGLPFIGDIFAPFPQDFENADTGLALTLGGGVDVRLWRGLAVGADIRWMRLLARETLDFAHIASRVSYRF